MLKPANCQSISHCYSPYFSLTSFSVSAESKTTPDEISEEQSSIIDE